MKMKFEMFKNIESTRIIDQILLTYITLRYEKFLYNLYYYINIRIKIYIISTMTYQISLMFKKKKK